MTNYLKNTITIFTLATLLFSCSKDEDVVIQNQLPVESQYRIKQIDFADATKTFFEYNSQNQITKITTGTAIETNVYDANGFLTKTTKTGQVSSELNCVANFTNDATGLSTEEIRTYDNGDKLKWNYTNLNAKHQSLRKYLWNVTVWQEFLNEAATYTYDSNGKLTETLAKLTKTINTYDSRGNLLIADNLFKYTLATQFINLKKSTFEYDNIKPKNYKNSVLSKNNISKSTIVNYMENTPINTQTENFTYDYNTENYVVKTYKEGVLYSTNVLEKIN